MDMLCAFRLRRDLPRGRGAAAVRRRDPLDVTREDASLVLSDLKELEIIPTYGSASLAAGTLTLCA